MDGLCLNYLDEWMRLRVAPVLVTVRPHADHTTDVVVSSPHEGGWSQMVDNMRDDERLFIHTGPAGKADPPAELRRVPVR